MNWYETDRQSSSTSLLASQPTPEVITPPVTEPLSVHEAKKHVEVAESDTSHDAHLLRLITAAREQWEKDTGEYYITRTMQVLRESFAEFQFPHRPVSSIEGITYYDADNVSQTLPASVYQLDTARSQLRLAFNQSWPTTARRWDAVAIDYKLGNATQSIHVPAHAKAAMLLLVGYYFENRDMLANENAFNRRAYEALVAKSMRVSYP